jgi:hypothetical protein
VTGAFHPRRSFANSVDRGHEQSDDDSAEEENGQSNPVAAAHRLNSGRRKSSQPNDVSERSRFRKANYFRLFACRKGSHAPFFLLLSTHCVIKSIPSTPS